MELERLDTKLLKEISEKVGASPDELLQTERLVVPIAIFQSLLMRHLIEIDALKLGKVKDEHVLTNKIDLKRCKELLEELVLGNEKAYEKAGIDWKRFVSFVRLFKNPPSEADLVGGNHEGCNFVLGCPTRLEEIREHHDVSFQGGHTHAWRWYSTGRNKPKFVQDECWIHNEMKSTSPLMDIPNILKVVYDNSTLLSKKEEGILYEKEP